MDFFKMASMGVAAGLASVIASSLTKTTKGHKYTTVFIIALLAGIVLNQQVVFPMYEEHKAEKEISSIPVYAAMKKYEPDAFKEVMSRMKAGGYANSDMVKGQVRPILMKTLMSKLPHASDEVVVKFGRFLLVQLSAFRQDPQAGYAFLFPDKGFDVSRFKTYFSAEQIDAELALYGEVIESGSQGIKRPLDAGAEGRLGGIFEALYSVYGDDLAYLAGAAGGATPPDKSKVFFAAHDLYSRIMELPEREAAGCLRFMFAAN